ncbi:type II toxin-antitoxin system RelE/ParE family toxin [Leptolyngbya sp. 15MV]|nr:type II toxin-antitoxin system RelE/ParE family toxin [Leptolyngbya sp. 15MV]
MKVELAAEAERDLVMIGLFIARDNPDRAASFIREIRAKCQSLAEFPRRYPVALEVDGAVFRRCGHQDYAIFYEVDDAVVTVTHILHGARDHASLFSVN